MDVVNSKTRSLMMAGIKSKDTRPELIVRRFIHSNGFRYRVHDPRLPGKPDLVMAKFGLVVFVDGCFWHRHQSCRYTTSPQKNGRRWQEKFEQNVLRDSRQRKQLLELGWRVLVIWECGLKQPKPDLSWLPNFIKTSQKPFEEWPAIA